MDASVYCNLTIICIIVKVTKYDNSAIVRSVSDRSVARTLAYDA